MKIRARTTRATSPPMTPPAIAPAETLLPPEALAVKTHKHMHTV